jgi:hypothetical protein
MGSGVQSSQKRVSYVVGSVELGHRIGDWRVCWLGGWDRHRIFYMVMVARVKS